MGRNLKACMGESVRPGDEFAKYFELVYWHEGLEDEKSRSGIERTEVINKAISLCGYFAIVTSAHMKAEDALAMYKSRGGSEKTFRSD